MAKDSRLKDDAEIYKPRDTRPEKEKFKSMNKKERFRHFNEYYRTKLIFFIILIIAAGSILYSIFGPKPKYILNVAVIDGCIDSDTTHEYQDGMTDLLNLDTKKEKILVDNSYLINESSDYSTANQQKLIVYMATGEIDVMIAPEEVIQQYAYQGYFMKLSDCLPTQLFSSLTNDFFCYTVKDDTQEAAYGVYFDPYHQNSDSKMVLAVLVNTKHLDNSVSFIQYLMDTNKEAFIH